MKPASVLTGQALQIASQVICFTAGPLDTALSSSQHCAMAERQEDILIEGSLLSVLQQQYEGSFLDLIIHDTGQQQSEKPLGTI